MRNAGLDESQSGIKIAVRNTNNLRYADDTTLMEESGIICIPEVVGKVSACNAGDPGSIPGLGRSTGAG